MSREGRGFWGAVGWAYAMSWAQRAIAVAVTLLLARLLGPNELGTFALAAVFVMFLQIFIDRGVQTALIQRETLDPEHLDAGFWLMLAIGAGLMAAGVVASGWWAQWNGLPVLARVIPVLSLILPIQALTVVPQALLQRDLDFRALAGATALAALTGGVVGIAVALAGGGLWAFVCQQLTHSAVLALSLCYAVPWRPRLRYSRVQGAELLEFSSSVYATALGSFCHRQADVILVGGILGPVAAGIYHMAERLVGNLNEAVTRSLALASLPHFSQLQGDRHQLHQAYLMCIRASALVTIPAMAGLAVASGPLVAMLGERWQGTAAVASLLCVLGALRATTLFTGPVLNATGRPGVMARLVWTFAAINVPALAAAAWWLRDAPLGDQTSGVALVRMVVFALVYAPLNLAVASRATGVSLREVAARLAVPLVAAGGIGLAGAGVLQLTDGLGLPPVVALLLVVACGGVVGCGIIVACDRDARERLHAVVSEVRARGLRATIDRRLLS